MPIGREVIVRSVIFTVITFLLYLFDGKSVGRALGISILSGVIFGFLTELYFNWRKQRHQKG